jgi:hypothetical protein
VARPGRRGRPAAHRAGAAARGGRARSRRRAAAGDPLVVVLEGRARDVPARRVWRPSGPPPTVTPPSWRSRPTSSPAGARARRLADRACVPAPRGGRGHRSTLAPRAPARVGAGLDRRQRPGPTGGRVSAQEQPMAGTGPVASEVRHGDGRCCGHTTPAGPGSA